MDFHPGPGKFTVKKKGTVEGRSALYGIVAITPDAITVY